jgi:hypothetical protein
MTVKIDGLDSLQKRLKKMSSAAKELDGENSVPLGDLLTPEFMTHHSKSASLESFMSDLGVHNQDDFKALPQEELENKVIADTEFKSWKEMTQAAAKAYVVKKLGF